MWDAVQGAPELGMTPQSAWHPAGVDVKVNLESRACYRCCSYCLHWMLACSTRSSAHRDTRLLNTRASRASHRCELLLLAWRRLSRALLQGIDVLAQLCDLL